LFSDEAVSAYLKSLHLQPPVSLDPPFTPLWTEYHAHVSYDVTMVRVTANPLHCHVQTRFEHHLGPIQWVQHRATETGRSYVELTTDVRVMNILHRSSTNVYEMCNTEEIKNTLNLGNVWHQSIFLPSHLFSKT